MSASLQDRIADKCATWEKLWQVWYSIERIGKLIFRCEMNDFSITSFQKQSCFEVLFIIVKVNVSIIMTPKTYGIYNSLLDLKRSLIIMIFLCIEYHINYYKIFQNWIIPWSENLSWIVWNFVRLPISLYNIRDPIWSPRRSTRTERIYPSGKQVFNYNNNVDLQKSRLQRLYLATRVAVIHGNGKKDTRRKVEVSQQRERRDRKRKRKRERQRKT